MSTKAERFARHIEHIDLYIKHQMGRRTEEERLAFRGKQIKMYDDKLERLKESIISGLNSIKVR